MMAGYAEVVSRALRARFMGRNASTAGDAPMGAIV